MRLIKPKKLKKGDLISIVSPASSPDNLSRINLGVEYLEKAGYRVIVGKNVGKYHGYLAGTDQERVDDIHNMFNNKDVKAIICVRGGYGSPRLLDKIDFGLIKKNPKIFVGYSDITALNMAFLKKANLVTFSGPMLAVDFWNEVDPFTEEIFWKSVTSDEPLGKIPLPEEGKINCLKKGESEGELIGGNLALYTSLIGTEFFGSMKGKLLFIEEIGELPYRIDRMLTQIKLAGVFDEISGIILGEFTDCNESDITKKSLSLGEVIQDYFNKLEIPVIYGFPHGHIKKTLTVPLGIKAKINTSKCSVEFLESGVS
jgi:muramoyltetrapeptide carboxypeptidase